MSADNEPREGAPAGAPAIDELEAMQKELKVLKQKVKQLTAENEALHARLRDSENGHEAAKNKAQPPAPPLVENQPPAHESPTDEDVEEPAPPSAGYKILFAVLGLLAVAAAGCSIYFNSLDGEMVFDDPSAIGANIDVVNPRRDFDTDYFKGLLNHDFWGGEFGPASHRSFRPITVLTYRWNWLTDGLNVRGFHVANVLLHGTVCGLFFGVCVIWLGFTANALFAALLFAVHPVHCDAVSSIVGRAEVLCAVFFLLSLLSFHVVAASGCGIVSKSLAFILSVFMAICSALSKETGLTVLAVCVVYDIVVGLGHVSSVTGPLLTKVKSLRARLARAVALVSFALVVGIVRVQHTGTPTLFIEADNAAAFHPSRTTRLLSFSHLYSFNWRLLVFPKTLCHDWNGDAIPLVHSWADPRLVWPLLMYACFLQIAISALVGTTRTLNQKNSQAALIGMALLGIPFIPSTGMFFIVGFTAAERVLYLPSMGFCILAGCFIHYLRTKFRRNRGALGLLFLFSLGYIAAFGAKTWSRNEAWNNPIALFKSAVISAPGNGKNHYNYALNVMNAGGHRNEYYDYYETAHKLSPIDPDYLGAIALDKARGGFLQEALPLFKQTVKLSKMRGPHQQIDPLLNLAVTHRNLRGWYCSPHILSSRRFYVFCRLCPWWRSVA